MRPKKLVAKYRESAGFEIYADLAETTNCVEFTMKAMEQVIGQPVPGERSSKTWAENVELTLNNVTIGFEPWIQFAPEKWDEMIKKTFTEMVDAWNEKYGEK